MFRRRKAPASGGDSRYSENIVVALVLASGGMVTIADRDIEDLSSYDLRMERRGNTWEFRAVHKQPDTYVPAMEYREAAE